MTKKEICELLTASGIEHDPISLKADLIALLPEGDIKASLTGEIEPTEDAIASLEGEIEHEITAEDLELNPELKDAGVEVGEVVGLGNVSNEVEAVEVYNKFGVFVRTYSREQHGDNFKELASQFENKING